MFCMISNLKVIVKRDDIFVKFQIVKSTPCNIEKFIKEFLETDNVI